MGSYKFNVFTGKLDISGNVVTADLIRDLGGTIANMGNFPIGDYGGLGSNLDAFGIQTDSAYDCMSPAGQSITVDHGSVA